MSKKYCENCKAELDIKNNPHTNVEKHKKYKDPESKGQKKEDYEVQEDIRTR